MGALATLDIRVKKGPDLDYLFTARIKKAFIIAVTTAPCIYFNYITCNIFYIICIYILYSIISN